MFLREEYSNDELYFFLHLRNQMFEGPQLLYTKGTYEVIDLLPWEKCKKILLLQFGGVDDNLYPNHSKIRDIFHIEIPKEERFEETRKFEEQKNLDKLVDMIGTRSKLKNGMEMIDPYFVLRMALEYYIREKKVWLKKLSLSFISFSKIGL